MENSRVITYNFGCRLIGKVAGILYEDFYKKGKPLNKVACIFGGKRPALFLKKHLAGKIKSGFVPPVLFSMDEFMRYIAFAGDSPPKISDLELAYLIWRLSKDKSFAGKKDFPHFLGWAKEIVSFIEQLDLEGVENKSLLTVEKSASIGYEVPDSINRLLENITSIRKEYHSFLDKNNLWTRGMIYLEAAEKIEKRDLPEFDRLFFCNLYYLNKSEKRVLKAIQRLGKSVFIFEGAAGDWPVLGEHSKLFNRPIEPSGPKPSLPNLHFYQGFDTHSQVSLAAELLSKIKDKENTLVLLSKPDSLLPFLSAAGESLGRFNVSLGYPLNRTSLYVLFSYIFEAFQSRKGDNYYCRDYLKVLKHPFVKNIAWGKDTSAARVLIHKIEEALTGEIKSSVGGSLFLSLAAIETDRDIQESWQRTLARLDCDLSFKDYSELVVRVHNLFFRGWENVDSLDKFQRQLEIVLDSLGGHFLLSRFPLEAKALDIVSKIKDDFASLSFSRARFSLSQIWNIFKQELDSARISFSGSPLEGTQVLGLLETRSLQFKNVLVLDANEGVLPKLKSAEPLIPSEVMMSLGLGRIQKEEEVQHYNFRRLIEGAESAYLIWAKNPAQEKSRFIESIIWEREKKANKSNFDRALKIAFSFSFPRPAKAVKKLPEVIQYLRGCTYSASRLNTYLECPLRFYYKYVLGLNEREGAKEGVKEAQIGDFIHRLLFEAYGGFLGREPVFDSKFKKYFKELFNSQYQKEIEPRMRSGHFLLKGIVQARLMKFLEEEKKRKPDILRIEALEKKYIDFFDLGRLKIKFKYVVDRIDSCRGSRLMIIDYKTGGRDNTIGRLSGLENMKLNRRQIKEKIKSFQLPLYCYFIRERFKGKDVGAYVYNLRTAEIKPFLLEEGQKQKEKVLDCCLKALKFILNELFDPDVPFEAEKGSRSCSYCPYYNACS